MKKTLGLPKIKIDKKILELWKTDKQLLRKYNLRDAEIMYKIEKAKAYQYNDIRLGALGNRFCNYYNNFI